MERVDGGQLAGPSKFAKGPTKIKGDHRLDGGSVAESPEPVKTPSKIGNDEIVVPSRVDADDTIQDKIEHIGNRKPCGEL